MVRYSYSKATYSVTKLSVRFTFFHCWDAILSNQNLKNSFNLNDSFRGFQSKVSCLQGKNVCHGRRDNGTKLLSSQWPRSKAEQYCQRGRHKAINTSKAHVCKTHHQDISKYVSPILWVDAKANQVDTHTNSHKSSAPSKEKKEQKHHKSIRC